MNCMLPSKALHVIMLMQGVIGSTAVPDIQGPGRTASPKCYGRDGHATCTSESPELRSESVTAPSILQRDSHVKRIIGTDDGTKQYITAAKDQELTDTNSSASCDGGEVRLKVIPENPNSVNIAMDTKQDGVAEFSQAQVKFVRLQSRTPLGFFRDIPSMPAVEDGNLFAFADQEVEWDWDFALKCDKDRFFKINWVCFYRYYSNDTGTLEISSYYTGDREYELTTPRTSCTSSGVCDVGDVTFEGCFP